jgi:ubiquinone/menaquinone biosynthesis C-methylase UbiE
MAASTQWQLAQAVAERYDSILVPAILGPAAEALVEWAELQPGQAVLDVGCGTGAATRAAAARLGPNGRLVGLDVNAAMIGVARGGLLPEGARPRWLVGSAFAMPAADWSFDLVLAAQTLQFLPERLAALREMRRVLVPGGQAVISLWTTLSTSPYFAALVAAIAHHIGPETAAGLAAAFSLSEADEIRQLLSEAGFARPAFGEAELALDLPPLAEFVPRHVSATPMAAGFAAASAQQQQAVIAEMQAGLAAYLRGDGSGRVPFRTHLVRAASL